MRFAPTDEQLELGRTAERLLAAHARRNTLPPPWDAIPQTLNRELWASLAELGLLGLGVPERLGGSGGDVADLCVLAERVGSALPTLPFAATATVAAVLAEHADSSAARAALAGVVGGSIVAVPAWETFPADMVPGRRAGSLTLNGSTANGMLAAVPFGLDAELLLAFADEGGAPARPVLLELAEPTTERTSVESLDVTEPIASLRLTGAPALPLGPSAYIRSPACSPCWQPSSSAPGDAHWRAPLSMPGSVGSSVGRSDRSRPSSTYSPTGPSSSTPPG